MRKIQDIKELHMILLEISKSFHQICEQNNIPYYMLGGTMLGAVRHKGFIPWDDDMDFGVPRSYFVKLKPILQDLLPDYYCLKDWHDDSSLWGEILKIEDTRTVIYDNEDKITIHGLFIDIFPLDFPTTDKMNSFSKNWWIKTFLSLDLIRRRKDNSMKTQIVKGISSLFGNTIFRYFLRYIASRMSHGNYVANFSGAYGKKEIMPITIFGSPKLYQFEDIQLYGVEQAHEYLTHVYDDYMILPSEDQRRIHITKAFLK